MANYEINEMFERNAQTDINKVDLANNPEMRELMLKLSGEIASSSFRSRLMFSDTMVLRDGKQIKLFDAIVKRIDAKSELANGNATMIDRIVNLQTTAYSTGARASILMGEPKPGRQFLGMGRKTSVSIERERMAWGTYRCTTERPVWSESAFTWDNWLADLGSKEMELSLAEDRNMRAVLFGTLPSYLSENDHLTDAELEKEQFPVFGGGYNDTERADVINLAGENADIEDLQDGDTFTPAVFSRLELEMHRRFISPIQITNGIFHYGILMSSRDVVEFQNNLDPTAQSFFNNTENGIGSYEKSKLYQMTTGEFSLSSWGNWTFMKQDNLSSDPTIIHHLDENGNLVKRDVPEASIMKEASMKRFNGTAFSPQAYVLGLVKGDTDFTNLIDFGGDLNKERMELKDGNRDNTYNYLLLSEQGAESLSYFFERNGGHDTWGNRSPYRSNGGITGPEAANAYCHLNVGSQCGKIRLSTPSASVNQREWKIIYSGPFYVGSLTKGLHNKQTVPTNGSTIIDQAMAIRIEAIYYKDASNTNYTLVSDANLATEITKIQTDLKIDAADGIIQTTTDPVSGVKQVANSVFDRRRVSYWDTVLTVATGQYSIIEMNVPSEGLTGKEMQNFEAFSAESIGINVGRKMLVDPMYQMPVGAIGVLYRPSRIPL